MNMDTDIRAALAARFIGAEVEVHNESHLHKGHAGDNGTGQTHYRVVVASPSFAGLNRVQAHRLVYEALEPCLKNGIHALQIVTRA